MSSDVLRLVTEYFRTYGGIRDHVNFDLIRDVVFCGNSGSALPVTSCAGPGSRQRQPNGGTLPALTSSVVGGYRHRRHDEKYVGPLSESTDELLSGMMYPAAAAAMPTRPQHPLLKGESNFFYLTSFTSSRSPLTRVYSERDLTTRTAITMSVVDKSLSLLSLGGCYDNTECLTLSPGDLINHPRYEGVRRRLFFREQSYHQQQYQYRSLGDLTTSRAGTCSPSFDQPSEQSPSSSSSSSVPKLRLLFLSFPLGVRRHLYALLKFMGGVAANRDLELDVAATNEEIVRFFSI